MDLIKIASDPQKELEGTEVTPWDDETVLVIARYNNSKFRNMQARLMEPHIRAAGRKGVSTEQANEILSKCIAKTILLGWRNLSLEGQPVEYSEEKALELLRDERLADFKETVMAEAQDFENYRLAAFEEDLGNSETSLGIAQDGL